MVHSLLIAASLLPAVVTTQPNAQGLAFARQPIAAAGKTTRAESRTIYLNRDHITLRPGDNDSATGISSIVTAPTDIAGWEIDDDSWQATVDCMREIYAPFDVTITDRDPGAGVPHIEAHFGGHPSDVDLPDNVAGVSPCTTDCSIIEHSIVFAFTDVMDDDPRTVCEVMAQEVAHSFGLDHEMLPEDPMTYLTYFGDRTFQDEMADCGEFGGRMCGISGSVCRERQNSFALLTERLGKNPAMPADDSAGNENHEIGGCSAGRGSETGLVVRVLGGFVARRRTRSRRHSALLQ
jgi:hypothetical protein